MDTVLAENSIAYLGSDRNERLDLYRLPGSSRPSPVVIFIDGGAFHTGGRLSERSQIFSGLMAHGGYAVLAIDYALSKSGSGVERWSAWPRNLLDIAAAVAFAYHHDRELDFDRNRIALVGASAGGTLALLAAFGAAEAQGAEKTATHIRSVVNLYGRVDWRRHTIADRQPDSHETAVAASPVHWIEDSVYKTPVLTLHGDRDAVVPIEQAYLLDASLRASDIPHEFHELKGVEHSFILAPEPERIKELLLSFLERTLKSPGE